MDFEYTLRLKDGRTVVVTGRAEVCDRCDCGGSWHDHITDLHIDSATLIVNDEEFMEIERSPEVVAELEYKIEDKVYSDLEAA